MYYIKMLSIVSWLQVYWLRLLQRRKLVTNALDQNAL
jgi:hypothetical protein